MRYVAIAAIANARRTGTIYRLFIIVAVLAISAVGGHAAITEAASPSFRIIDVKAEYGQLIVEVQHFNVDGAHWFYEDYTFQGREAHKQPRLTDAGNRLFLKATDTEPFAQAPTRIGAAGDSEYYLPPRREWVRTPGTLLDSEAILSVIQQIQRERQSTGWDRGQNRLTVRPLDFTAADKSGADLLKQRFIGLVDTAYILADNDTLMAYNRPFGPVDPYISAAWGTVSTFFPDADTETTSVDGFAGNNVTDTFTAVRAGAGNQSNDLSATVEVDVVADTVASDYTVMNRGFVLFDTSSLPDADTISSATFDFVGITGLVADTFAEAGSFSIVTTTPASNTAIANSDYANTGTTKQSTDITLASITADSSTYTVTSLNATGLSNISKTSITKFGGRITFDNDNVEPTWASGALARVHFASAEEVLSGDKRPRLVVTHISPTAAITGTIGDGATEQEVRDGSGTIIITLTSDTWVAAGGTFDAQRQAIINGLDAAESETNGWNAQVRDQIGVTSVVRTSSTGATITVSAAAVSSYQIDANEVITMTVPNAALVTSGSDITATPTIAITTAAESAAVSGTLGGSGGTPAEIVAGGETVIITLTNTAWAESGATFDATRQAVLDGLVSDGADQNGWDSLAFAVGDVVRTSGTVVTITLSAESAYAIPATETITTTVPASAVGGGALGATPTFAITPSFQLSGTRVSAAIDLSSVTDVAYCAIGWEAVTPTNTTVLIETSVDGGTTFSTAVNGSCPTGLTVGGSLATITDFRTRVTLTTTDTSATPVITALGLIVEDTSGQELYYQLNTTPSATLTDRSSQSHTGTMSFPVAPSGISNSADPLESTEPALTTQQALRSQEVTSEVTGAATSPNIFSQDVGFEGLPGQGVVNMIAEAGDGLPKRFVWFIFIGLFTIGIGMVVLMLTSELLIAAVAMAVAMGIAGAIGGGLLPLWTLYTYIPMVATYLLFRRGFPI